MPGGEASLGEALYRPVADRLAQGPCTVGQLLDLPSLPDSSRANPAELAGMLIGSDQAMAVRPAASRDEARATALNHIVNARSEVAGLVNTAPGIASAALGVGWACSMLDLAVWCRVSSGRTVDPEALSRQLLRRGTADEQAKMTAVIETTQQAAVPLWRSIGLLA